MYLSFRNCRRISCAKVLTVHALHTISAGKLRSSRTPRCQRIWQQVVTENSTADGVSIEGCGRKSMTEYYHTPAPGFHKTFYKRVLPCPPAIAFASREGKAVFAEAMAEGTTEGFFKLIEQFRTQDEPAFCGLASLAMVLNALSIDPRRAWKGPWRVFSETMLDCCHPLDIIKEEGITLQQAACLAKCNGAHVEMLRYGEFTLDEFRDMVSQCSRSDEQHLVVSYSRKTFQQTGDGHFSPVGAYHAGRDLVLILDTARFKYPPHWVPLPLLFVAMEPTDPATGLARGLIKLQAPSSQHSVLFTLDLQSSAWQEVQAFLEDVLPQVMRTGQYSSARHLLREVVSRAPLDSIAQLVAIRQSEPHAGACHPETAVNCTPLTAIAQLLHELRASPMYEAVHDSLAAVSPSRTIASGGECANGVGAVTAASANSNQLLSEKMCMILCLLPHALWDYVQPEATRKELLQLLHVAPGTNVNVEAEYLRRQWSQISIIDGEVAGSEAARCVRCSADVAQEGRDFVEALDQEVQRLCSACEMGDAQQRVAVLS